jgi:trimeric autotransporter adhesin
MKKTSLIAAACMLLGLFARSQNLGINSDGSKPDKNAILDVKSTSKGVLFPRMTSAQRQAIPATTGMMVYDVTTKSFWYNTGAEWKSMGASALSATGFWDLNGNAGTDGSNFLGTTDNVRLQFRVNNVPSGRIDHINSNVFFGYSAGYATNSGQYNTGIGHEALLDNGSGSSNTAVGRFSLKKNISGGSNTAVGMDAMLENTVGARNTAVGMLALLKNVSGNENVAVGFDALAENIYGGGNIAIGTKALHNNVSGSGNTVVGSGAFHANTQGVDNTVVGNLAYHTGRGNYNTVIGAQAMWFGNQGSSNVAVGHRAMMENQTGHNSVAVGIDALRRGDYGSYNTAIGNEADVAFETQTNSTAIGYGAVSDASNKVRIGNSAVTVIEGQVPFTTPSDGRFKFNIEEDVKGLPFIMQLRPVTYQFDVKRFDGKIAETASLNSSYNEAEKIRRTGFIAQEVEKAAMNTGYNFSGVIKPKKEGDHYSLSYDAFVVPLVKAVQEQQQVITDQNKKIADLQQQLDEIKKLLQEKK